MMAHKSIGKFQKQRHIKFFKEKAKFNHCVSVFQCIIMRYFVTLSNLFQDIEQSEWSNVQALD